MTEQIVLERETANDESATVVAIYVEAGAVVQKDQVLFDIENSKATQEVTAPISGVLTHGLALGDTVQFGISIGHIVPPAGSGGATPQSSVREAAVAPVEPVTGPPERHTPSESPVIVSGGKTRFSNAAAELITKLGLDRTGFKPGFVTTADIDSVLYQNVATAVRKAPEPLPLPSNALPGGKPVGARKRAEIATLQAGAGATMLSVVGIDVGPIRVEREAGSFLEGRITDLVIYEASRMLAKYPRLNAYFADGQIYEHPHVHTGLAIDGGGRLVVYGIEHADRTTLPGLANVIADATGRYIDNQLTVADLTRATFTVTDLSGEALDFVLPLLPQGQSCILGITHNARNGYRIYAGFDHRVTEGREVALFLGELNTRLQSFAAPLPSQTGVIQCSFCGTAASKAVRKNQDRGLLKIVNAAGQDSLCCASCWSGW